MTWRRRGASSRLRELFVDGRDNLPIDGQLPLFGTESNGETVVWIWRAADFLEALDGACGRSR